MNSHMLFFLKIFMDFEMYSLFLYCITNSCDLGFYKCLLFMSGEGGLLDSLCLWMNNFINFVLTNI